MQTKTTSLIVAGFVACAGFGELVYGIAQADLLPFVAGDFLTALVGWGAAIEVLGAAVGAVGYQSMVDSIRLTHVEGAFAGGQWHLGLGTALWLIACALVAYAFQSEAKRSEVTFDEEAKNAPLHPRLATFVDFHWGTLAAYGFGIFFAELGFVILYTALVAKGTVQGGVVASSGLPPELSLTLAGGLIALTAAALWRWRQRSLRGEVGGARTFLITSGLASIGAWLVLHLRLSGLSPVWAFVVAGGFSLLVAFGGGFLGAANSKRLSTPEATVALLYFGLPIPALLTAMHQNSWLMLHVGYRLREVVYLSSLLGEARPELGYWLLTATLGLGVFLGINLGFVSTSTGRLDLRASYEFFIASRHVSVFRPGLIVGVFLVLLLGIVPPLIVMAIIQAAETVVERTRIRRLGLKSPLASAAALNEAKLRAQTPTAMMTALSVGGVGVGVMALVIVLSVMSGFEADLQKKILGTNSHGMVLKYGPEMPEYVDVLAKVKKVRGIAGATPFILNEVMISSEGNVSGSMIKGIDPATVGEVTDLPEYLLPGGDLNWLVEPEKISARRLTHLENGIFDDRPARPDTNKKPEKAAPKDDDIERDPMLELPEDKGDSQVVLPGIIVGRELAASLKVVVGDRVNVVSPLGGELGPQGPMPKSRAFRVAGIFYSGMYEYDSKFVYIKLSEAETFFNVKGASGIEVKVTDVDNARGTMKAVYDVLEGYPYRTKDWGEMNRNLFAALRLEKLVMGIILSIIVIVAAGLIVATVIMLVLEKRKEIAVLKALGVPDGGIVKIFLTEGLQIGVVGGLLGLVAGLVWCLFIERVGIKLDPQVYYIPSLPVRIEPFQTVLSVVIAILVTFLASVYPALKASQVEPVDGLKSE